MKKRHLPILLMLFMFVSNNAIAHGIHLFCRFEGSTLYGEGYFAGGNPAKSSKVTVLDPVTNSVLAETLTSEAGTFTVFLDQSTPVLVVLDAGHGHRATWTGSGTTEKDEPAEHHRAEAETPVAAIATGVTVIVLFFGVLYLWKRRHAA